MKQLIHTDDAPAAIGPYSQAVRAGDTLYCSGQIALDPGSGELTGDDAAGETRQLLSNLTAVLASAGATPADVVKTTVYLVDMADYAAVNAVYAEVFGEGQPARAAVAVAALPRGARVEIDAVAVLGG